MAKSNTHNNAIGAFSSASAAAFKNLGTVVPLVIFMGLVAAALDMGVYRLLGGDVGTQDQTNLIKVLLAMTGVALLQEILLGPIVGAVSVYVGRMHSAGERAGLYDALNFAMGRYRRLFMPHLIAQLSIQIGLMLLMLPGIIYVSMYAFVDPVACLEKKVWPLDRSKKLTRGRRGSIVLIYLPIAIVMQGVALAELWALGQGLFVLTCLFSAVSFVFFIVSVSFYKLYEGRTMALKARAEEKAAAAAVQA
ncbi:MAG: hypothetical protein GXP62_07280 [Oligoflexia bacterium]|nr:hypothetical protein [Oligoflexia bacterium]